MIVFGIWEIMLKEFVPSGHADDGMFYIDVLRRLEKNITRKRIELWKEKKPVV